MKHKYIDNYPSFNRNLSDFLEGNNINIHRVIVHKPYHVTIMYTESDSEIDELKNTIKEKDKKIEGLRKILSSVNSILDSAFVSEPPSE